LDLEAAEEEMFFVNMMTAETEEETGFMEAEYTAWQEATRLERDHSQGTSGET
jgi:hypothetical protein